MRILLAVPLGIVFFTMPMGGQTEESQGQAIYADHAKVAAAYNKGGGVVVPYDAVKAVPEMRIAAGHRDTGKPYTVEYHETETETYYIIEGGGVVVTGGTIAADKTRITGGQRHRVAEGDILVIPPKTPHWWEEVSAPTNYLTVSIRKP